MCELIGLKGNRKRQTIMWGDLTLQACTGHRAAARGNHDSNHRLASPFHGPPRESALSSADTCINTSLKCDIETFDL